MTAIAFLSLLCALFPAIFFCWNLVLYRAPRPDRNIAVPPVSVLIPARNEEQSIVAAVESVLASEGLEFEVIVLDDSSTDGTAEQVRQLAQRDQRVRLETAPPLPAGWNGKQHACYVLASLARHEVLCFLDADVRLAPQALAAMSSFLIQSKSELVSGFPRQLTETPLEWLLLPLIHFILLGFLPIARMRRSNVPSLAAGCGQFFLLRRTAYRRSGTHAAIRTTMHDGILLPRLFRQHGFHTDLADLTGLAQCRMYRSAGEVWHGLAKNATEGLASPARIVPFTIFLLLGQVLPILIVAFALTEHNHTASLLALLAFVASLLPRLLGMRRFRQRLSGALLHPAGMLVLLALQWYAFGRKLLGYQTSWKQRAYTTG